MELNKSLFIDFPSEQELMNMIMHTSSTVWENQLLRPDIEKWLSNFKGEVFDIAYERLIALWLLSHFTFYNKDEVTHLCKVVYRDLLHLIIKNNNSQGKPYVDVITDFFDKTNIISAEKLSGSGGFIAYFFRQKNDLPLDLFNFSISNIPEKIENIILIDDVTLTAGEDGQLFKFLDTNTKKHSSKNFYLITLLASEASIEYLTKKFGIKVVSAIKLDKRDKCFFSESDVFSAYPSLLGLARHFAEHYGEKVFDEPLGYGNGQYTFGFFYNTPDNTLPIFWGQIKGWIPIINRYHKNYKDRNFLEDGIFI